MKCTMQTFSKTLAKQFYFPLTLTVFHEFPLLFPDFFIKLFSQSPPPDFLISCPP